MTPNAKKSLARMHTHTHTHTQKQNIYTLKFYTLYIPLWTSDIP